MRHVCVCMCTLGRHTHADTLVSATWDLNGINVLFLGSTLSYPPQGVDRSCVGLLESGLCPAYGWILECVCVCMHMYIYSSQIGNAVETREPPRDRGWKEGSRFASIAIFRREWLTRRCHFRLFIVLERHLKFGFMPPN